MSTNRLEIINSPEKAEKYIREAVETYASYASEEQKKHAQSQVVCFGAQRPMEYVRERRLDLPDVAVHLKVAIDCVPQKGGECIEMQAVGKILFEYMKEPTIKQGGTRRVPLMSHGRERMRIALDLLSPQVQ